MCIHQSFHCPKYWDIGARCQVAFLEVSPSAPRHLKRLANLATDRRPESEASIPGICWGFDLSKNMSFLSGTKNGEVFFVDWLFASISGGHFFWNKDLKNLKFLTRFHQKSHIIHPTQSGSSNGYKRSHPVRHSNPKGVFTPLTLMILPSSSFHSPHSDDTSIFTTCAFLIRNSFPWRFHSNRNLSKKNKMKVLLLMEEIRNNHLGCIKTL